MKVRAQSWLFWPILALALVAASVSYGLFALLILAASVAAGIGAKFK